MGSNRTIVPILIALTIAVLGSLFMYQWIQKQKGAPGIIVKNHAPDTVQIVVAKVDMPWGTKITREMLKQETFLKSSISKSHFTTMEDVEGRVLTTSLKQGDPIVEHRLAPVSVDVGGMSSVVQPGKRAIAVKGDKVIGLSGLINPGNRVDVLVTIKDPRGKADKTKTVLENIMVLASGTQMMENEKGDPVPADVYTLEVTPEEGERLSLAATKGKLQFMLRSAMDYEKILTKGVTIPQMLAAMTPPKYPKQSLYDGTSKKSSYNPLPRRRPKKNQSVMVEIIKGLDLTKAKM